MASDKKPSVFKNFMIGGASGMFATCCIQPIDFVKVQLQIRGEGVKGVRANPFTVLMETVRNYGMRRLYTGLDSALLRQATYTTARMGIYKTLYDWGEGGKPGSVPLWQKAAFSLTAGGLAATVGNPADLALIRMQSDHTLPEAQRRHYKGVGDALSRIVKEEGVLSLWKGSAPTVIRAMAINLGMLATYDQAKDSLTAMFGQFNGIRGVSSFIAAFFACLFSLPFDNVKTKFQRMAKGPDGQYPYSSFSDCFMQTLKNKGFAGYYVGFSTYVVRIAPHAIITLLATDYLNRNFNQAK